jgi:hypothetical protein
VRKTIKNTRGYVANFLFFLYLWGYIANVIYFVNFKFAFSEIQMHYAVVLEKSQEYDEGRDVYYVELGEWAKVPHEQEYTVSLYTHQQAKVGKTLPIAVRKGACGLELFFFP